MNGRIKGLGQHAWFGPLVAVILLLAFFAWWAPDTFARPVNLTTMLRQTAVVALAATGMTLIMVQGGIDLSVGSLVALTTVVVARCLRAELGPCEAVIVALVVAVLAGLLNGALVVALRITPFIVTLGTMSAFRGMAKGLAREQKIDADPKGLDTLMIPPGPEDAWMLLPHGVWLALGLALGASVFLSLTVVGRKVVAVGSNEQNARLSGVAVGRVRLLVYALGGLFAGVAGVLEYATLTVGDPTDSFGLELDAIAAVVIGGGSLSGGQGSVAGTLLGAMVLTVIKTGCTHVGVPNWVQEIFTGVIIVVAMGLDRLRQRGT